MKPGKGACAGLVVIMMLVPKSVWKTKSSTGEARVTVRVTPPMLPADDPSGPYSSAPGELRR